MTLLEDCMTFWGLSGVVFMIKAPSTPLSFCEMGTITITVPSDSRLFRPFAAFVSPESTLRRLVEACAESFVSSIVPAGMVSPPSEAITRP